MLDSGDVLIKVFCSAVSHRDARAVCCIPGAIRRDRCVPGSDLAGMVISSAAPRFRPGDHVLATGYGLGFSQHGGYAEYALVPGGWVLPLPEAMNHFQAMALGSAGLAAAMAITRMEMNGLRPENGPVLVTGATGGVGSLAVDMLSGRGYEVAAMTRKPEQAPWLTALGAARVIPFSHPPFVAADRRAVWAAAIDVLGGEALSGILSTVKPNGMVACLGDLAGSVLNTTLMPFVLRGISILGIDSVYAGFGQREKIWGRLADDLRPRHLDQILRTVGFDDLPDVCERLMTALACGRTVVQIAPAGNTEDSP